MNDKRKTKPLAEQELYKLSPIEEFIAKERRHDELDRLYEVRQQKKVWLTIVGISALVNFIFLILAFIGD
jgi:hypothetical protein